MDTLIRYINQHEEIWYSEDYFKKQLELAYQAGLHKGIKVEFHSIAPYSKSDVENMVDEFKRRLQEEYEKAYSKNEIYRVGNNL